MDLKSLKTKQEVRKFVLDDEEVISLFGEPVDFYIYWPMKMETFVEVTSMSNLDLVKRLLVDEKGEKLFADGDDSVFDRIHHLVPRISLKVFEEMGK